MCRDPARDQADAANEQDEHQDSVEKACRLKENCQIHQDAGENDDDARDKQNPADDGFAVEK